MPAINLPGSARALFRPARVLVERAALDYPLGRALAARHRPYTLVDDHNRIETMRRIPDVELLRKKRTLVIGVRKSLRLVPNRLSADYMVPFTSSGCPAACLYCYLLCTFFSNSYLRVFVNREAMLRVVERKARRRPAVFELGSNSDLIVEDSLTGSLSWAVERFACSQGARATLATKFAAVKPLLDLDHRGKTTVRISLNPASIIRNIELGTARLPARLGAANLLHHAGYPVGFNLAPVVLVRGWRDLYRDLLEQLSSSVDDRLLKDTFFEIIFMTYGYANEKINAAAFPRIPPVCDRAVMQPKGRGKMCYRSEIRQPAADFLTGEIRARFPQARIKYVV